MDLISLTDDARHRLTALLKAYNEDTAYLTTTSKGCGGNGYSIGIVDRANVEPVDDIIELAEGLVLAVDGRAALLLAGTVVDWSQNDFSGEWVFNNPNATGHCGCGSSFTTNKPCS